MFIHLTAHSTYSLQASLLSPSELVHAAKEQGMSAIALTDRYLLTGAVEFVHACKQADIQPILGLEIDLEDHPLTLLATNMEGWSNLCRLSSALALRAEPQSPCTVDFIAPFSGDLIAIAPWSSQEISQLKQVFSRSLYLALQDPAVGLPASNLARNLNLSLVVTHPVHYLKPEQANLLQTLAAIRLNCTIDQLLPGDFPPSNAYFTSQGEMLVRFSGFRAALEKTQEIAKCCQFDLPLGAPNMPVVPVPEGITPTQFLRQKAEKGARTIYGKITSEIQTRLDHELEIIAKLGYEPIFLIVEDVLNFARQTNVPYSSRGSAASSLVAHCLGITSPDPLRLNLYFERFLNPARQTPPDIDTDLCSRRRDSVIQHVFDTYGTDRVAMVSTINRFRPRSALGEVAKAYGLTPVAVRKMVEKLPHAFWMRKTDGESPTSHFAELRKSYPSEKHQHIFDDAEAILKLPRHLSVHPGGLIVAPGPVTDLVPVMRSGSKGMLITQLDLESVEAMGLVKIDLLGIRGLTVLGDIAEYVQESQPDQYATSLSVLAAAPTEDTPTADMIEQVRTIGCFQIESPGMRTTLREIHARSEDDIMAALALYRPGPLTGGLKDAFVKRFKGEEEVTHIHPALAPLLEETYGVILYQEQVLRIASTLAGFSLAEADLLRRAMSHFDPGKRMKDLRHKFIHEAETRSGILPETGEQVWEMMAAFAGYGFPKAHAASYAQVAWQSAWAKTHFPAEFMSAVLANWGGYYSQRVYLSEARRMGLAIRPPHVNHSGHQFSVGEVSGEKTLFMGLEQVKNLSRKTIARIIRLRPFPTLEDFLCRVDPRPREAKNLASVGAFDNLGYIPAIMQRLKSGWQVGQPGLFGGEVFDGEDWGLEQKMDAQNDLLGVSLEAHPLELLADQITHIGAISTEEAASRVGHLVHVAGVRQTSRRSRTSKGDTMLFLTLEDLSGVLDVIVFPNVYRWAKQILRSNSPMVITGRIEMSEDHEPFIKAEKVELL